MIHQPVLTGPAVVPSRRWEASREGVEDYGALYIPRDAIAKARQNGKAQGADAAQTLLDVALERPSPDGRWAKIYEITRMTRDYETDFRNTQRVPPKNRPANPATQIERL